MTQPRFWSRLFGWAASAASTAPAIDQPTASASRPTSHGPGPAVKSPALRQQRHARREQLIALVRENMIRAGVLSASYKFKVLTLEPTGQQFIVMFDIQPGRSMASDPATLAFLESSLQALAKERLALEVRQAYWRHVAPESQVPPSPPKVDLPGKAPAAQTTPQAPAVPASVTAPADRSSQPAARSMDDVSDDELKALRAALAGAQALPQAKTAKRALPEGWNDRDFEPTASMDETPQTDFSALSETQYGQLR